MKYILLEDWAHQNGIKPMDAKNWARRKKINAKKQRVSITRWVISEDERPPKL